MSFGSALLGGCGGSAPSYSLPPTFSCLKPRAVSLTFHLDDTDYFVFDELARSAGGGALYAELDHNSVVVVFERSVSGAERTEAAYKEGRVLRQGPALAADAPDMTDHVRRSRNAVLLWGKPPDDRDAALVTDCLSG